MLAILRVLGCKDKEALAELLQGLMLNKPGGKQGSLVNPETKWVAPDIVLGRLREFVQAGSAAPLETSTSAAAIMSASATSTIATGVIRREVCPSCDL